LPELSIFQEMINDVFFLSPSGSPPLGNLGKYRIPKQVPSAFFDSGRLGIACTEQISEVAVREFFSDIFPAYSHNFQYIIKVLIPLSIHNI
jgi:hypothetical protein